MLSLPRFRVSRMSDDATNFSHVQNQLDEVIAWGEDIRGGRSEWVEVLACLDNLKHNLSICLKIIRGYYHPSTLDRKSKKNGKQLQVFRLAKTIHAWERIAYQGLKYNKEEVKKEWRDQLNWFHLRVYSWIERLEDHGLCELSSWDHIGQHEKYIEGEEGVH